MKILILFTLSLSLIAISGCSKSSDPDSNRNKFPAPHWQTVPSGLLAYSMTAVIAISDSLNLKVSDKDEVAAFIGDECRGIGVFVKRENAAPVFYLLIKGNADETAQVKLKYYNSSSSYMYLAGDFLKFELDYNYGSADLPAWPSFAPM